jgi:hypothetical protein
MSFFASWVLLKGEGDAYTAEYHSFSAAASMKWTKQAFLMWFFRLN